jgi:GAF domain-containing protein
MMATHMTGGSVERTHVGFPGERRRLSDVLAELASMSGEALDVAEMLQVACERSREVLDADGAVIQLSVDGVTLEVAGQAGAVGDATRCSEPPTEPCADILRTGVSHALSAAVVDPRYPTYATSLREMGIASTAAVPLRHGEGVIGVLALVRTSGDDFVASIVDDAQHIADVVAANVVVDKTLRAALAVRDQLEHALQARVVVEQAKGMVAAELGVSINDALDMIRRYARAQHLRLADVAGDIVERTLAVTVLRST